jgi:hypothetical protein
VRGRKPGFHMTDAHREKIRSANILNALQEHVEGKREMSATQINAANILLRKVLPDLQSTTHTGNEGGPVKIIISTGVPRSNAD